MTGNRHGTCSVCGRSPMLLVSAADECPRCRTHMRKHGVAWPAKPDGGTVRNHDRLLGDDDVLAVARAHGTTVAAGWSGRGRSTVLRLRQEVDGYVRGRGHPTRAEMDRFAPRMHCPCLMCVEFRDAEAHRSAMRYAGTRGRRMAEPAGLRWRDEAACRDVDPDVFFPVGVDVALSVPAQQVCKGCPVRRQCLAYAVANGIPHGVYGGLRPDQRSDMHPLTPVGASS